MKFNHRLNNHVHAFLELNKTERLWHFPLLAGLCVGLCLLVGWYFDRPAYGNLSSIGALVILYFTQASLAKRMVHLCVCAFGFSIAFALGYVFSFNSVLSSVALGLIAFLTHLITVQLCKDQLKKATTDLQKETILEEVSSVFFEII
ncbi:hypothetical protein EGH90_04050 [Kaistella haifensis]|nr:hypothetical protein EGH90_04050 [Kaistella haifensis]